MSAIRRRGRHIFTVDMLGYEMEVAVAPSEEVASWLARSLHGFHSNVQLVELEEGQPVVIPVLSSDL